MHLILGPAGLTSEINFTIPKTTLQNNEVKRVGVFVSGGLDSSALLCLVLAELKNTNKLNDILVTVFTIVKGEGSTYYAHRIVDAIAKHFGVTLIHVNNVLNDEDSMLAGRAGSEAILRVWEEYHHDMILYMGVNNMAPDDIRPFDQKLKIVYQEAKAYRSPFISLHKPQILDIYYKLGCEDIIKYTHSCTAQAVGSCNECYSCKEREWGFTALNKEIIYTIDPDVDDVSFGGTWQYSIQNN